VAAEEAAAASATYAAVALALSTADRRSHTVKRGQIKNSLMGPNDN
jgi:hypothetical protein